MIIENKKGEGISAQISNMGLVSKSFNPGFKFLLKNDSSEIIIAEVVPLNSITPINTRLYPGWNPEIFRYVDTESYADLKYSNLGKCDSIPSEYLDKIINISARSGAFQFAYDDVEKWEYVDETNNNSDDIQGVWLSDEQVVKLYVNDYGGILEDRGTNDSYNGDISELKDLTYYVNIPGSKGVGDISAFSNLTYGLVIEGSDIYGDIVALSKLTYIAILYGNGGVYGDISALSNLTHTANFRYTKVVGDIVALSKLTYLANFENLDVFGDIAALANITHTVSFSNTDVFGDIAALNKLTYSASFNSTNVSGDIVALSNLTYYANFSRTDVYGDIAVLSKIENSIIFNYTDVNGELNPHNNLSRITLNRTNMSSSDTLQSLRNMDTNFTTTKSRAIQLVDNIDHEDTEVINLMSSLISKGCTITFV